ncbi:MAG: RHS repeat-associated core domain-containing protein [Cyclobacteriaceae bacterium]|nr:RHS repeat-associated core domain-containing protein [Cyclobacteriaceae bacterium]
MQAGQQVERSEIPQGGKFFYGSLGEVVKNIRTVVVPGHGAQTYATEWEYDTWNRLVSMIYPDGEQVEYHYNEGGLLSKMTGKKKGYDFSYVQQLGYDKFEQRVFLAYGNGTKTTYDYEPERRRLKGMTASTASKRAFMDNTYTYDAVNNILGLENKAEVPDANLMGGSSKYSYEYDDLYRLTTATGSYKGATEEHSYTLNMEYNTVGGITQKTQSHQRRGNGEGWNLQKKTTYDMGYDYGGDLAHAPVHIGEKAYSYDANGNMTGWDHDVSGQRRKLVWDEENRLRAVLDNGSVYHYIYDAGGQRVLKGQGKGQTVFVNGEEKGGSGQIGNFTVYVSPFVVLRSGSYTKHYYIEGQRIVSKLGGGWDDTFTTAAGGGKVDFQKKEIQMQEGMVKNMKFLGLDGQVLTAGKSGKTPPGQLNGSGGQSNPAEPNRYFYHPDHLGSTSYITDATGEVYQHLEYFAFGETFVEEHSNTDRTPYLYNGKELDEETGLYYYGARYYDAQTSVWVSVDPMAEKYPGLSGYNYVANNPLKYVDPDGLNIYEIQENGTIRREKTMDASHTFIYIDKDGERHTVGTYDKNDKGLVNLTNIDNRDGSGAQITVKARSRANGETYISGEALAALIGASASSGEEIYVNRASNADGSSPGDSETHKNGNNLDIKFAGYNGSRRGLNYEWDQSDFYKIDQDASASMNAALNKFGWKGIRASNFVRTIEQDGYWEAVVGIKPVSYTLSVSGTRHLKNHYDHEHLESFHPTIKDVLPVLPSVKPIGITFK